MLKSRASILMASALLAVVTVAPAQSLTRRTDNSAPTGAERKESPDEAVSVEGLIRLDATVTDQGGHPITGLERADFRLVDNGQTQKIVAFRASKRSSSNPNDSLAVILLIDTLNLSPDLATRERQRVTQFLNQNSGKLAAPVTIYSLEDSGLFLTSNASTDGAALARDVASDNKSAAYFLAPHAQLDRFKTAPVEASLTVCSALSALRALATIATAEVARAGRKLLFWIGPSLGVNGTGAIVPDGTGLLRDAVDGAIGYSTSGKNGDKVKRDIFQKVCWFSALLRQARVTLDSSSVSENVPAADIVRQFIPGVPSYEQASWMNLFKDVLAVQSGGHVLSSADGLVAQMNDAIEQARIAYSLTFDPPPAAHTDEYHLLKVELSKPGLTVQTSAGYYDQPFYNDPDPGIQHLTIAQLAQMLETPQGRKSAEQEPSAIVLTQRLTTERLQSLSQGLHDKKLRESLNMIANKSTFLDPPPVGTTGDPPPDQAEQQRILIAARTYLQRVIPTLPDLFATRTAVYYGEVAPYPGLDPTAVALPLHAQQQSRQTVLYRQSKEVLSEAGTHGGSNDLPLQTYGTFGPILNLLQTILNSPGYVTWGWWEGDATGKRAVFRYKSPGTPKLTLSGCCYPNGGNDARIEISADTHGELAIDPTTGAVIRVQAQSDMPGFVPAKRSEMMVSYGPLDIGGKTYIVPLRSVSIWRGRSVSTLSQWNVGFATWGPFETQMNVFTFDHYHVFRGNARILPGVQQVPR